MKYEPIILPHDLEVVRKTAEVAFSPTPDSSLDKWFSFSEMELAIRKGRGLCVKATNENDEVIGIIYAQQENPINGKEGTEKWVIILAAVIPEASGKGIGSELLKEIESKARSRGAIKMFVYTNEDDARVIQFYKKNGYEDAGSIKDYQYGKDNSAVFLLKYL